jgi:hypothetical protein
MGAQTRRNGCTDVLMAGVKYMCHEQPSYFVFNVNECTFVITMFSFCCVLIYTEPKMRMFELVT